MALDVNTWDDSSQVVVGHGDACVLVQEIRDRRPVGAFVITPEAARQLGIILIEQAAAADKVRDDDD